MITSGGTTTLGLYDFKIGIEQFGQTGYWVQKANGYPINKRIMLDNGDIVKSTIDGNTNDPNANMAGWVKENSASQMFDDSGKNQQEINNVNSKIQVWVERFVANGEDLKVDAGPAFRRAIAYASSIGSDAVWFSGNYKVTSVDEIKFVLPFDDGTLDPRLIASDSHGVLPSEAQIEMPVYFNLPFGVSIKSTDHTRNSLDFGWDVYTSAINTAQPIAFCCRVRGWDGSYIAQVGNSSNRMRGVSNSALDGFTVLNAFIGRVCEGSTQRTKNGTIKFQNVGIPEIYQSIDYVTYDRIEYIDCYAGTVVGAWWLQRNANTYGYMPPYDGNDVFPIGWCDSLQVNSHLFSNGLSDTWTTRHTAIDAFYDTYFYKSVNNTDRLSTTRDGTNPAIKYKFYGIASRAFYIASRQGRGNQCNTFLNYKYYGCFRSPIFSLNGAGTVGDGYSERTGLLDKSGSPSVSDANDYYMQSGDVWNTDFNTLPALVAHNINQAGSWYYTWQTTGRVQTTRSISAPTCSDGVNEYRGQLLRIIQAQSFSNNSQTLFEIGRRIGKDINTTSLDLRYKFFPDLVYLPPVSWINPSNLSTAEEKFNAVMLKKSYYNNGKLRYTLNSANGTPIEFESGGISSIQLGTNVQAFYNFTVPSSFVGSPSNVYFELAAKNREAKELGASTIDVKVSLLCAGYTHVPLSATIVVNTDGRQMIQLFTDHARTIALTAGQLAGTSGGNAAFILTYTASSWV